MIIIIMQRTIELASALASNPKVNTKTVESISKLWQHVSPDSMRQTQDGIKYVKIEL